MKVYYIWMICLVVMVTGCTAMFDEVPQISDGSLTLYLTTSATRVTKDSNGEPTYNEDAIKTLDLFFYDNDAQESDAAKLHKHVAAVVDNEVEISLGELSSLISSTDNTIFKLYAVVNCKEAKEAITPTISELKALTTKADAEYKENDENTHHAFRSSKAPEDFVMTNFIDAMSPTMITFTPENKNPEATISFKRVAAKIRVALDIVESIEQNGKTWKPDDDIRLFISNGVRTARLDGSTDNLTLSEVKMENADGTTRTDWEKSDYFHIMTSGSKSETSDYGMARELTKHESNNLTGTTDNTYLYYNDIPFYSYPNSWTESMVEDHRTMLTVVIPWKTGENANDEYQLTYYSVPVNKGTDIVSNAYYYLRMHIGMMGSVTPEKPFELDAECEIADWGKAENTDVALRPIRILQFNQEEYTVYNETEISIPFISTHNCAVISCTGKFYLYNASDGIPVERTFDTTIRQNGTTNGSGFGKDKFFYYEIDNDTKTLTFKHKFFDIWSIGTTSGNKVTRVNNRTSTTQNTTYHKFNSRFEIQIVVRHSTNQTIDAAYERTLSLIFYPPIYIETEKHTVNQGSNGRSADRGFVYVNGSGTSDSNLAGVYGKRGDETVCMTIVNISQLDDEDKANYVIGDPRSYYINNDMSTTSMETDNADRINLWTVSNSGRNAPNPEKGKPIWVYGNQWWNSADETTNSELPDTKERTLRYYYPTKELDDTKNMIAPKFRITSGYAYLGANPLSREGARRRCASYQEYGYPAGRWRLPTRAELLFLIRLSKEYDIIPKLFASGDYWHAHGQIDGGNSNDKTATGTAYVRCIYDDWYWENVDGTPNKIPYDDYNDPNSDLGEVRSNMDNYAIFTLGDRPKENPQAEALIKAYKTGKLH